MMVTTRPDGETASAIDIHPRDVDFTLDEERIGDWNDGDAAKTVFLNALSIMFPHGERFFITSVAKFRAAVTDPKLAAEVVAFTQQEALHTREHIAFNSAIERIADAKKLDAEVGRFLGNVRKFSSSLACLGVTIALEHFTAILAKEVLENPGELRRARDDYRRLWMWHALEECEHKAVAFDVWQTITNGEKEDFRRRLMIPTTGIFIYFIGKHLVALMRAQKVARSPKAWARVAWYLFGNPGIVRRIAKPYLAYYRKGFHPNDIDDTRVLRETRSLVDAWA